MHTCTAWCKWKKMAKRKSAYQPATAIDMHLCAYPADSILARASREPWKKTGPYTSSVCRHPNCSTCRIFCQGFARNSRGEPIRPINRAFTHLCALRARLVAYKMRVLRKRCPRSAPLARRRVRGISCFAPPTAVTQNGHFV